MTRFQVSFSPDTIKISDTKVFISYKTEDWEYANRLSEELRGLGFGVIILPPASSNGAWKTEEEIKSELSSRINEADYICIVISELSLKSRWVNFEFKRAAGLIGRVVFVNINDTGGPIGHQIVDSFGDEYNYENLYVKHSTLTMSQFNPRLLKVLAEELLTEPDWYWYNNKIIEYIENRYPKYGLSHENWMKKKAREFVLSNSTYKNKFVREVIPVTRNYFKDNSNISDIFKKVSLDKGLLKLQDAIRNDEVKVSYAADKIEEKDRHKDHDDSHLRYFIVTEV